VKHNCSHQEWHCLPVKSHLQWPKMLLMARWYSMVHGSGPKREPARLMRGQCQPITDETSTAAILNSCDWWFWYVLACASCTSLAAHLYAPILSATCRASCTVLWFFARAWVTMEASKVASWISRVAPAPAWIRAAQGRVSPAVRQAAAAATAAQQLVKRGLVQLQGAALPVAHGRPAWSRATQRGNPLAQQQQQQQHKQCVYKRSVSQLPV
jgi:hypothetical protein